MGCSRCVIAPRTAGGLAYGPIGDVHYRCRVHIGIELQGHGHVFGRIGLKEVRVEKNERASRSEKGIEAAFVRVVGKYFWGFEIGLQFPGKPCVQIVQYLELFLCLLSISLLQISRASSE